VPILGSSQRNHDETGGFCFCDKSITR
jgi:hypothetical protein